MFQGHPVKLVVEESSSSEEDSDEKSDENSIEVESLGGRTEVLFRQEPDKYSDIYLKGPAQRVYTGVLPYWTRE